MVTGGVFPTTPRVLYSIGTKAKSKRSVYQSIGRVRLVFLDFNQGK